MSVFNPGLYGNLSFAMNGPNYRVRGVEGEVNWRATEHLSFISSFAWNSGEQVNNPTLIGTNGQPVALFPTGGPGSPLAQSPPFQGNLRVRYERPLGSYDAFAQIGAQHTAHSYASVDTETKDLSGKSVNYDQAPYSTYDASLGVHKDAWSLELFGQNLTDERAQLYKNFKDWIVLTTVNRPRVIGVNASYKF
jgi:outer membrane receptor protein involved in Fe transport